MRHFLAPFCALLILSGCGRTPADPPRAAIPSPTGGADASSSKETPPTPAQKTPIPDPRQSVASPAKTNPPKEATERGSFDPDDSVKTLDWLIGGLGRVRAAAARDAAAGEREWEQFTRALQSVSGQKIRWVVSVDSALQRGVVTEAVRSRAEPGCQGLRLKPHPQPAGYTSFVLEVPTSARRAALRAGDRVRVTGVVEQIETEPRRSPHSARSYGFSVRLRDYTVTPAE